MLLAAWERLLGHARDVFPEEAVGILGGPPEGPVSEVIPLPNIAAGGASLADPFAQFQAERTLRLAGLELLGVYHSHPEGGASLSSADGLAAALRPQALQLVVALGRSGRWTARAYRPWSGGEGEVRIEVQGPSLPPGP